MRAMTACCIMLLMACGCATGPAEKAASDVTLVLVKPAAVVPPQAPEKQVPAGKVVQAAVGRRVTVSSTHLGEAGEGPAGALVDGDLRTRWSSNYSAPQEVVVDLGAVKVLRKVRLHWEAAAATEYSVLVSADGKTWKTVAEKSTTGTGARVDEHDLGGVRASRIKLDLRRRVNPAWGFSLYEIETVAE